MKNRILKSIILFLLTVLVGCSTENKTIFSAGDLEIVLNDKGEISKLIDLKGNVDYLYNETVNNPILSISINGELEYPASCRYNESAKSITLNYPKNSIAAKVKIIEKDDYITFELISISNKDKIEYVLWGPYNTSIKETIGETIGVVRNKDFAIGIQALNKRTLGGYPTIDDSAPTFNIFGTTSLVDISDSLVILYRGNTAIAKEYGSSVQAYTRNRNKERVIATMNYAKYMAQAYSDKGIVGSKIAIFGCKPQKVLNTIEAIELAENLPHPMLEGVWNKRSPVATSAYLILDFSTETIDEAIAITKKAGLKYLYQYEPFETWGHFNLDKKSFPNNWESMKECVDKAEKEGIKLGVHTLSNFITTNDSYVTPIPDERLAKVGSSLLVKAIDANAKRIEIKNPVYFDQTKSDNLHAAVVGKEIIRYEAVSETAPWILLNCQRGAFGTKATSHKGEDKISKLADHAYKTFLTNTELSVEVASRIADLFNKTGLKQISFDGLEGNSSTGMGDYGQLLFVDAWYSNLIPEIKNNYIMDASRPGHYFWHMFTRMNWGEPWYAGFRESQTSYRLLNQDYFRRNYIPAMLGWFSMRDNTSIEDIEWLLARSAAFNAGYSLLTSAEIIEKNGFGEEILEKIKQWEKARMSNAFSKDQKKRMENISAEFSLETVSENRWNLIPYSVQRFEHKYKVRQPGEPIWSAFLFKNKNKKQPIQFILTAENTTVSNISFEIDNYKKIVLDMTINPDQYLKYDGGSEVVLYSNTWNEIKRIPIDPEKLVIGSGEHEIKVDCQFTGKDEASLKLELKTAGEPEKVIIE